MLFRIPEANRSFRFSVDHLTTEDSFASRLFSEQELGFGGAGEGRIKIIKYIFFLIKIFFND